MKKILSVIILSLLPFAAFADFVGFAVGAAYWNPDPSGDISYKNSASNDLKDNLRLGDSRESVLWAVLEHPVPLLPNVKLVKTSLGLEGRNGTLNASFGDVNAGLPGVDSDLTLDQLDAILYYEVLDNWVNLDVGLDFKMFDGTAQVSRQPVTTRETFSVTVPLLYGNAEIELPFTGFSVGVEASLLSVSDNSVSDVTATVGYESDIGLGAMLGLRRQSITLKDADNVDLDFTVSGPFAAVYYHF